MEHALGRPAREAAPAPEPGSRLCAGDWVRVRSREEVLATLDPSGCLDGMPFMPEMLRECGKAMQVARRAHKTCDTIYYTGSRRLAHTVHLMGSRCDGSAHGGCEAACALFWNDAWLEPLSQEAGTQPPRTDAAPRGVVGCSMEQLVAATQRGYDPDKGPRYGCQATDYLNATTRLSPYDPRQYIEDLRSRNVGLGTMLHGAVYRVGAFLVRRGERLGRRLGRGDAFAKVLMAWYDALQKRLPGGVPYPRRIGTVPKGQRTPDVGVGTLGPGSRVRVKPYTDILGTLDCSNRTRGLYFDAEHVPYCDKEFTVRSLVHRIVDERTGYMLHFKSPSIILEHVVCQGTRSDNRMFCPRAIYPYWRPVWLTPMDRPHGRDDPAPPAGPAGAPPS